MDIDSTICLELSDTLFRVEGLSVTVSIDMRGIVLAATGDLDLFTVSAFQGYCECAGVELLKTPPERILLVDLRGLEYISSSGISKVLDVTRLLQKQHRKCTILVGEHTQPARVLALSPFSRILNVTTHLR